MPGCLFGMCCFQKGTGAGPPNPPLGGRYPLPRANPLSLYFRCLFWPPSWSWVFLAHLAQPLPSPRSFAILAASVFLCVLSLLQSPDQIFIYWVVFLWSSPSRLNIWKILLIFLLQACFFFSFFKLPLKSFFFEWKASPNAWCCSCFLPTKENLNFWEASKSLPFHSTFAFLQKGWGGSRRLLATAQSPWHGLPWNIPARCPTLQVLVWRRAERVQLWAV